MQIIIFNYKKNRINTAISNKIINKKYILNTEISDKIENKKRIKNR